MVEQQTPNLCVMGSSPVTPAIFKPKTKAFLLLFFNYIDFLKK